MQFKDYRALAGELKKEGMFKPKPLYGFATIAGELTVFGVAFAALLHTKPFGVLYFALHFFLGWSCFRFFVLVHEAGHRSLFTARWANDLTGLIASIFCFMPFYSWKHIHHLHHKWVGVIDKDPTQNELVGLKEWGAGKNLFFRVIWFSWIPVMFLVFIFRLFWGQPFRHLMKGEKKEALLQFLSLAVIIAPRIALVAAFGWHWALVWLAPMMYAYLFVNEQVSLPQHTGLFPFLSHDHPEPIPFHEQDSVSRTTARPGLLSVFLSYNFNLHNEHHLFPSVPWYWLPRVTKRVSNEPTYRQATVLGFMLSIRTKDPVEVYTKALPPHGRPPEDQDQDDDNDSGTSGAHDIVPAA
jgi:acyl-lipid omega-6 desaturase (Delta-12 desaturase)